MPARPSGAVHAPLPSAGTEVPFSVRHFLQKGCAMHSRDSAFTLLAKPESRIVAANFLMQLGLQAIYFVGIIGCATYDLGADALVVSSLVLVLNVMLVVMSFVAGPLVDAVGPRRTLAVTLSVMAVAGLAGWLLPLSYGLLYALAAVQGAAFGVGSTSMDAYPRFVSDDPRYLQRVNSLVYTATSVAVIAGPALGGLIVSALPTKCDFAIMAFASLPAIALVWSTVEKIVPSRQRAAAGEACAAGTMGAGDGDARPKARPAGGARGFLADLAEGVRITWESEGLRMLFLIGFLGFFAYGAFDSLESLFYRDVLRAGAQWMGWLSAISGVGGTLGSLAVLRIPQRRLDMTALSAMLLVTGLGSMLYVGTGSIAWACVGQLVCGLGFGAMGPTRTTLTQAHCDVSHVGRVTSVMRVGMNSAGVLPLFVAPFLADAFGVQAVLFGASTMVAVVAVAFVARTRTRRESLG
jgi:MFS family permease